jgi:hypothetical protein
MESNRTRGLSRRAALRRTAAFGLGATVTWLASAPAHAQAGKLAKEAVRYVDKGDAPGKDCDDCVQYVPPAAANGPATCRIVDGTISPHGHCVAFTPRPKG